MANSLDKIWDPKNEVTLLFGPEPREGDGMTEAPLWHEEGYVTFVRHRMSEIYRWDPATKQTKLIAEKTGRNTGACFDLNKDLILCEGENRRITRVERGAEGDSPAEDWPKPRIPIAESWEGKSFNKPNDIVCRSDGSLYFTDPAAKRDASEREIGFAGVFRITPEGKVQLATDECEYPNGLAFSPDEKTFYAAITRKDEHCLEEVARGEHCTHRKIRAFDVQADGSLTNNRVLGDMNTEGSGCPDGMKVDSEGRVYCTGDGGIWVYEPTGEFLGILPVLYPRNLVFGGPELSVMYITAGESFYSVQTKVHGIPPHS